MNIGILSQSREKYIDGVNRSTVGVLTELLKIDKENKYYFVGRADWLKMDLEAIDIIPNYRSQMDLNSVLFANKLDIVHSHWRPFTFNSKLGCAKILTIHDLIPLVNREWTGIYGLSNGPIRKTAEEADVIITDSESTKRDVMNFYGINEEKIKVIYLGTFEREPINITQINENVKRLENVPFILSVSTMRRHKNVIGLVKAFRLYKEKYPDSDLKLVLTGKADQSTLAGKEILDQIKDQKDIIITGYVTENELSWLYKQSLAFAYVSLYEGFGLPVLEALSFGKAVISSNTSSLPEVGGNAAEYCDPYDIESIVVAIENVMNDENKRKKMELQALVQASKFSYRKTAEQTLEVYNMFR